MSLVLLGGDFLSFKTGGGETLGKCLCLVRLF